MRICDLENDVKHLSWDDIDLVHHELSNRSSPVRIYLHTALYDEDNPNAQMAQNEEKLNTFSDSIALAYDEIATFIKDINETESSTNIFERYKAYFNEDLVDSNQILYLYKKIFSESIKQELLFLLFEITTPLTLLVIINDPDKFIRFLTSYFNSVTIDKCLSFLVSFKKDIKDKNPADLENIIAALQNKFEVLHKEISRRIINFSTLESSFAYFGEKEFAFSGFTYKFYSKKDKDEYLTLVLNNISYITSRGKLKEILVIFGTRFGGDDIAEDYEGKIRAAYIEKIRSRQCSNFR